MPWLPYWVSSDMESEIEADLACIPIGGVDSARVCGSQTRLSHALPDSFQRAVPKM